MNATVTKSHLHLQIVELKDPVFLAGVFSSDTRHLYVRSQNSKHKPCIGYFETWATKTVLGNFPLIRDLLVTDTHQARVL